jgi:porin
MRAKIDAIAQRPLSKSMIGLMVAASVLGFSSTALAEETKDKALDLSVSYSADVTGVVSGGLAKRGRLLDNLEIGADLDLDKAMGWKGATAHALVLNNSGGMPNEDAGTAQGIDNIEVSRQRLRLFEAWVQQSFAGDKASALAGLYDLNSEFYANDSAGLLIAPAFGIGSELAATGPNGPSIFPSTSLAVRLKWTPREDVYVQAAALNANAGVLGDPGGVDTSFDSGALVIAEAGWTGAGKIALGAWRYSDKQDDIRDLTALGDPAQRTARGAYLLLERHLGAAGAKTPRARLPPSPAWACRTATPPTSRAAGRPACWSSTSSTAARRAPSRSASTRAISPARPAPTSPTPAAR